MPKQEEATRPPAESSPKSSASSARVSAVIITKNEEQRLRPLLDSLAWENPDNPGRFCLNPDFLVYKISIPWTLGALSSPRLLFSYSHSIRYQRHFQRPRPRLGSAIRRGRAENGVRPLHRRHG
jgi:hypothetical protein